MKLTKRVVESVRPGPARKVIWDDELRGFGLRVTPSGVRSYLLDYHMRGRRRRMVLGRHGPLTCDVARRKALEHLAALQVGCDPLEALQVERLAPTVNELVARFLSEHVDAKRKPSTAVGYRSVLMRYVVPRLGRMKVADVTRGHVTDLHYALRKTPFNANRTLAVVSRMFTLAEKWGIRPDGTNPCRHVERYRERARERFLSAAELARLGDALAEAERTRLAPPVAIAAIRLLILTGARKGEVLGLRWEYVDWERRCLRLPDSKTGAKVIPLNAPALEVLRGLSPDGSDPSGWVIAGRRPDQPFVGLHWIWHRIRERAELGGVRIHDLRHTHASVLAGAGSSLIVIGRLLGHRVAQTTQRYAHLSDDPLREASDEAGKRISAAMSGRKDAVVVSIGERPW